MSSSAILTAAQSILDTALAGTSPAPSVLLGKPERPVDPVTVYLLHRQSPDQVWTNGWVKREHRIIIGLLLRDETDSPTTETAFLAYHDAIASAFYAHHDLNGSCATCELAQVDGPDYAQSEGAFYRTRLYALTATEDVYLTFA